MAKAKAKPASEQAPPAEAAVEAPKKKGKKGGDAASGGGTDLFSQCVLLCQKQQWREAALLGRRIRARALSEGNLELVTSIDVALAKIDYSLRRQMAAAAVRATAHLLAKEFLLDVG